MGEKILEEMQYLDECFLETIKREFEKTLDKPKKIS